MKRQEELTCDADRAKQRLRRAQWYLRKQVLRSSGEAGCGKDTLLLGLRLVTDTEAGMCVTWTLVVRVRGALSAGWAMVSTLSRVRAQLGFSLEREVV